MPLRLRRICSADAFFNTRYCALRTPLIKRGYNNRLVKDPTEKVRQSPRVHETSIKKESHRIPIVIAFNTTLPNIPQVISSNLKVIRFSQRCLEAFSSPLSTSYRPCKNLRDILVSAKHRRQALTASEAVVPEIGARRVFSLQREPGLTLFALPTNKDVSHYRLFFQSRLYDTVQQMQRSIHRRD